MVPCEVSFTFIYLLCLRGRHRCPRLLHGGRRTTCAGGFPPAAVRALGTECSQLGLAACARTLRDPGEGSRGVSKMRNREDREVLRKLMTFAKKVIKKCSVLFPSVCSETVSLLYSFCSPGTQYVDQDGHKCWY